MELILEFVVAQSELLISNLEKLIQIHQNVVDLVGLSDDLAHIPKQLISLIHSGSITLVVRVGEMLNLAQVQLEGVSRWSWNVYRLMLGL